MEPRQWTHYPYCGGEMIIDSNCENCEIANDDRLTRQDYDDLLDNLADWNEEPGEET